MITIYKYALAPKSLATHLAIETHEGAILRACHEQHNEICVWFEVDTDKPKELRRFEIYGTGHKITTPNEDRTFVGTVFLNRGEYVFHVYERA